MSKAWPKWWGWSSSPIELLEGAPKLPFLAPLSIAGFALSLLFIREGASRWPRWEGWLGVVLVAMAAVPWLGVVLSRWRGGSEAPASRWVKAVQWCVAPFFMGVPFLLLHDEGGRGGKYLALMLPMLAVLGLLSLGVASACMHMATAVTPSLDTGRRPAMRWLLLAGALLVVSGAMTASRAPLAGVTELRAEPPTERASITMRRTGDRCEVETSEGVTLARRCDGPEPRLLYAGRRYRGTTHRMLSSMLLHRGAYLVEVDGRLVSIYGVPAEAFLGARPSVALQVAMALVLAAGLTAFLLMRRRVAAWRALPWVEMRVREDGLLAGDGRRFLTDVSLPMGATVLVEDPQRLGVSYRDEAVRVERVLPVDSARWAEVLAAAERLVWMPLTMSLSVVGGLLLVELLLVW